MARVGCNYHNTRNAPCHLLGRSAFGPFVTIARPAPFVTDFCAAAALRPDCLTLRVFITA